MAWEDRTCGRILCVAWKVLSLVLITDIIGSELQPIKPYNAYAYDVSTCPGVEYHLEATFIRLVGVHPYPYIVILQDVERYQGYLDYAAAA